MASGEPSALEGDRPRRSTSGRGEVMTSSVVMTLPTVMTLLDGGSVSVTRPSSVLKQINVKTFNDSKRFVTR